MDPAPSVKPEVRPEVKVERKTEPDDTLKVVTATIEGMKHWNQYKHIAPMLFHLTGQSAVPLPLLS